MSHAEVEVDDAKPRSRGGAAERHVGLTEVHSKALDGGRGGARRVSGEQSSGL